jgi:hypothetical protein
MILVPDEDVITRIPHCVLETVQLSIRLFEAPLPWIIIEDTQFPVDVTSRPLTIMFEELEMFRMWLPDPEATILGLLPDPYDPRVIPDLLLNEIPVEVLNVVPLF